MADHRHKRDTDARRLSGAVSTTKTVSAGLAALATTTVIAVGVLNAPISHDLVAVDAAADVAAGQPTMSVSADARDQFVVSRSASRKQSAQDKKEAVREARADGALAATAKAVRRADTKLWTTAPLNLWTESGGDAEMVGEIEASRQVLVTGRQARRTRRDRRRGQEPLGHRRLPERGQARDTRRRRRPLDGAVPPLRREWAHLRRRHRLPLGVPRLPADHDVRRVVQPRRARLGRAIDIMTSDVALGTAIAEFLRSHASELHLYDILWRQHIWTPVRAGEGWRDMSEPGLDRPPTTTTTSTSASTDRPGHARTNSSSNAATRSG